MDVLRWYWEGLQAAMTGMGYPMGFLHGILVGVVAYVLWRRSLSCRRWRMFGL